jgi:DamX protein
MSVLANTRINQIKLNEQANNLIEEDNVEMPSTGISVIARIDYIQRFSKHLTVVIAENPAIYSKVARQYLTNISQTTGNQDMNVAFVAASNKINDIQMRCRLIEQLFANTLFDPEKSLAVSILRLAKQNSGTITVVVEHAQALSLQIKYELCQLVDTAKKTQNNINVVILGLEQTGKEIGQNRTLFDKKTSIVDAVNGQIITLDHSRFKNSPAVFKSGVGLKIGLITLISLTTILLCWFVFSEFKSVNFAVLPEAKITETPKTLPQKAEKTTSQNNLATTSDIQVALLSADSNEQLRSATAERIDILQALMLTQTEVDEKKTSDYFQSTRSSTVATASNIKPPIIEAEQEESLNIEKLPFILNEQYYLNSEKGYVIQITGFSDLSRLKAFIKNNSKVKYFSYQKNLNTQKFFVLTSKIYNNKVQAREALNKLPQPMKALGSFLKSVSTIKREINTVS